MSGQHRLTPSPELRRHWTLVRGPLVALVAGVSVGSWWAPAGWPRVRTPRCFPDPS